MPRPFLASLLAVLTLAPAVLVGAGCGGGDSGGSGSSGGTGESPQKVVASGDPKAGASVFADKCAGCHGKDAGGGVGPKLAGNGDVAGDAGVVVHQIREGGGGMPAFKDELDDKQIADVASFVVNDLAKR